MATITRATSIDYDPCTDVRKETDDLNSEWIRLLNRKLAKGKARIEPGLLGWGGHTHTLHCRAGVFHVTIEG